MNLLVTGGCGFIGSNFIRFVHNARTDWKITNLDALTYSGNPENLADLDNQPWYNFVHGSINDRALLDKLMPQADAVVHFAAESHVDRSILDSGPFIQTNIVGTQCLLDALRANDIKKRFVHVSTDEVYGEVDDGGQCTWYDLACEIARRVNPACRVSPCTTEEFPRPAKRPAYSVLDLSQTEKWIGPMPDWKQNLADVLSRPIPQTSGAKS